MAILLQVYIIMQSAMHLLTISQLTSKLHATIQWQVSNYKQLMLRQNRHFSAFHCASITVDAFNNPCLNYADIIGKTVTNPTLGSISHSIKSLEVDRQTYTHTCLCTDFMVWCAPADGQCKPSKNM